MTGTVTPLSCAPLLAIFGIDGHGGNRIGDCVVFHNESLICQHNTAPGERRAPEAQGVVVVDVAILGLVVLLFAGCIWSARAYRRAAQAARHARATHAWARGKASLGLATGPRS